MKCWILTIFLSVMFKVSCILRTFKNLFLCWLLIAKRRNKVATRSNFLFTNLASSARSWQFKTLFHDNKCNFSRKSMQEAWPNLTARVKNQEQSWNILGKSHSSPLTARLSIGKRLTNEYGKKKNSEVLMTDKFFDMLYNLGGNHPAFSPFYWRENNPRDASLHFLALEKGQNIQSINVTQLSQSFREFTVSLSQFNKSPVFNKQALWFTTLKSYICQCFFNQKV